MLIIHQNSVLVKYVRSEIDKFLTILRFVLIFSIQQKEKMLRALLSYAAFPF